MNRIDRERLDELIEERQLLRDIRCGTFPSLPDDQAELGLPTIDEICQMEDWERGRLRKEKDAQP
jgi:hypothetical protein